MLRSRAGHVARVDGLHGDVYNGCGYEAHKAKDEAGQGAGESGQIKHTLVQASYPNHMEEYAHLTQVQ